MNYIPTSILLIFTFLFLTSCNGPIPKEIEALQVEAIRIHDEVMPKMSTINKTRRKLKKALKQDPEKKDQYYKAIKDLETADDAMMDWMAGFKKYHKLDPSVDAVQYFNSEIEKIKVVQDQMLTAIANGKKELSND